MILVVGILFSILAGESLAQEGNLLSPKADYTVNSVTGEVLAWVPYASKWRQVKISSSLPEGTIVQIPLGSALVLGQKGTRNLGDLKAANYSIIINVPTVFRIQKDTLRKINIKKEFISKLPSPENLNDKEVDSGLFSLMEAWTRYAAEFGKEALESIKQRVSPSSATKDITLGAHSNLINILTPQHGALTILERRQAYVTASWQDIPTPNRPYRIMLWKNKEQPHEIDQTTLNRYKLSMNKPGTYYFRIESQDGSWKSSIHQFTVIEAEKPKSPEVNNQSPHDEVSPLAHSVKLQSPFDGHIIRTSTLPLSVSFQWEPVVSSKEVPRPTYRFRLVNHKNVVLQDVKTQDTQWSATIKEPGLHQWSVEVFNDKAANAELSSPRQLTVELIPRVSTLDLAGIIQNHVRGTGDTTVQIIAKDSD